MATIKSYTDNAILMWNNATAAARVAISLLAILCVSLIGGVGYWASLPNYVPLVSDLDHEKMAKVVDALSKAGIQYELAGAGGVLRVDKGDFANARMIAAKTGISSSSDVGDSSSLGGGMWLDPTDRKNIDTRKKEQRLAKTIQEFGVVSSATVHLNIPVKSPFARKKSEPTASVLLALAPQQRLTDEQATSIASLVAFAVQDLEPELVQITDKTGRNYTIADKLAGSISSQIDFVSESERKLARKAETQLTHFLGPGNASVQVSLDLTFKHGSTESIKYDSENKVASKESLNTTTTTEETPRAGAGITGVASNVANGGGTGGVRSQLKKKTEEIDSTYLVPEVKKIENETTPIKNFMTVSVLINESVDGVASDDAPLKAKIEAIVRNAVGFKETKDTISVEFLPFNQPEEIAAEAPFDWTQINELVRNVSLAFAAILALVFGFMTLRRFKPIPGTGDASPIKPERMKSFNRLAGLAKSDPEAFANIIQNFANTSKGGGKDSDKQQAA